MKMALARVICPPKNITLPERFVMVSVHIAHEKVKDSQVHDIQEPPPLLVGFGFFYHFAIVGVGLPCGFAPLVVRSSPRVTPSLARRRLRLRKESGQADFQGVGRSADGVTSITVIAALT